MKFVVDAQLPLLGRFAGRLAERLAIGGQNGMAEDVDDGSRHGTSQDYGVRRRMRGAPDCRTRAALIPVADKLDDGMARHRFALHLAGNLARALVFVYANRRHHFLLPDQGLDTQACLQHRDGDHPMGWIAMAGRGALPDARGAIGERLDIDDLMATIGMEHRRERMLLVTLDDVPKANAISIIQAAVRHL